MTTLQEIHDKWIEQEYSDLDISEEFKQLMEHYHDRDVALNRIMLEFWRKAGCPPDAEVVFIDDEDDTPPREKPLPEKGWALLINGWDDPVYELYLNREPIAAWYTSFRGVYQAGGYIVEGDRCFYASDCSMDVGVPKNTLVEDTPKARICAEVARDSLLNQGIFEPEVETS